MPSTNQLFIDNGLYHMIIWHLCCVSVIIAQEIYGKHYSKGEKLQNSLIVAHKL